MPSYDYTTVENRLRRALELVQMRLARADEQEVLDYLDVAEYGLAFETLACSVVKAGIPVSITFCALIQNAAHRMHYSDNFDEVREPEVAAALTLLREACRTCTERS